MAWRSAAAVLAAMALALTAAPGAALGADGGATAPAASGDPRGPSGTNTVGGVTSAPASTQATVAGNELVNPPTLDKPPAFHELSARQAIAIADRLDDVRRARRTHRGAYAQAYLKGATHWQVSYFTRGAERREVAQVLIDDLSGTVLEHWTGHQVAWTMARGYPGAFGRKVNVPWIWIPLAVLFVLPFVDPRRPFRWLHLDLLALSFFSVSLAFFNDANIGMSVPLAVPPLLYLLARMLTLAVRNGSAAPPRLRLLVPARWLAVAVVLLLGGRIVLNVMDSNVIDVGYAGVIGGDHLLHGEKIYGAFPSDNASGDTYGPVVYEAYAPAVALFGWSGSWDDLPAAHGAAVAFDVLAVVLLFLLGRRVRGPDLGVALAYAWVSYPFTLYAASTNTNDTLVAVLVLLALLAAGRPVRAGAAAAVAGLTKFAPLALAPVLATHGLERGRRVRGLAWFALGFVVAAAIVCLPLLRESLSTFYDRTVGFQASRGSPFSPWGLYGWDLAQHLWQAAAVALAVGLAVLPVRRDLSGLAAACAAILIALQIGVTHWFYLYIVWFFPLVMLAVLGRERERT